MDEGGIDLGVGFDVVGSALGERVEEVADASNLAGCFYRNPVPAQTHTRVIMDKGDSKDRIYTGRIKGVFFQDGYPLQPLLRARLSRKEWDRMDQELTEAWNSCRASKVSCSLKCCLMFPGVYFLGIPLCYLIRITNERDYKLAVAIGKVNKYILRPRGMYLKEQSVTVYTSNTFGHAVGSYHHNREEEYAWYEIALEPDQINRLETTKTFRKYSTSPMSAHFGGNKGSDRMGCCTSPPPPETEFEDLKFARRWPLPRTLPVAVAVDMQTEYPQDQLLSEDQLPVISPKEYNSSFNCTPKPKSSLKRFLDGTLSQSETQAGLKSADKKERTNERESMNAAEWKHYVQCAVSGEEMAEMDTNFLTKYGLSRTREITEESYEDNKHMAAEHQRKAVEYKRKAAEQNASERARAGEERVKEKYTQSRAWQSYYQPLEALYKKKGRIDDIPRDQRNRRPTQRRGDSRGQARPHKQRDERSRSQNVRRDSATQQIKARNNGGISNNASTASTETKAAASNSSRHGQGTTLKRSQMMMKQQP